MVQESTSKGLRRFRAVLAEMEKAVDICPDCDTLLISVPEIETLKGTPGEVASLMPYHYCERCKNYYLYGRSHE